MLNGRNSGSPSPQDDSASNIVTNASGGLQKGIDEPRLEASMLATCNSLELAIHHSTTVRQTDIIHRHGSRLSTVSQGTCLLTLRSPSQDQGGAMAMSRLSCQPTTQRYKQIQSCNQLRQSWTVRDFRKRSQKPTAGTKNIHLARPPKRNNSATGVSCRYLYIYIQFTCLSFPASVL